MSFCCPSSLTSIQQKINRDILCCIKNKHKLITVYVHQIVLVYKSSKIVSYLYFLPFSYIIEVNLFSSTHIEALEIKSKNIKNPDAIFDNISCQTTKFAEGYV